MTSGFGSASVTADRGVKDVEHGELVSTVLGDGLDPHVLVAECLGVIGDCGERRPCVSEMVVPVRIDSRRPKRPVGSSRHLMKSGWSEVHVPASVR